HEDAVRRGGVEPDDLVLSDTGKSGHARKIRSEFPTVANRDAHRLGCGRALLIGLRGFAFQPPHQLVIVGAQRVEQDSHGPIRGHDVPNARNSRRLEGFSQADRPRIDRGIDALFELHHEGRIAGVHYAEPVRKRAVISFYHESALSSFWWMFSK